MGLFRTKLGIRWVNYKIYNYQMWNKIKGDNMLTFLLLIQ